MKRINFNADWIFYKSTKKENAKSVHLPHDAMREQARVKDLKNGSYTGFFPSGDYYYEKTFYGEDAYVGGCEK